PANCDQVSPVAEKKNSPTTIHVPATACLLRAFGRPSRRAPARSIGARARRRRIHHITSPPSAIGASQLAANSEYTRPGSPRCRLRCSSESHVRSGSACPLPYWTESPRTSPLAGSVKTTREYDDEGSAGSANSTRVVSPPVPGTTP